MKIVTAANGRDSRFKRIIKHTLKNAEAFGHEVFVFDLGGLGFGIPVPPDLLISFKADPLALGPAPFKAELINFIYNQIRSPFVWIDGDALFIRNFDISFHDFDVGVTMRRQEERDTTDDPDWTGLINTGVMFFNFSEATQNFINLWVKEVPRTKRKCDQQACNHLVLRATDLTSYGEVFVWGGIRFKNFKTDEFNWYYFPEVPPAEVKILHFKGCVRRFWPKYRNWPETVE